MPVQNVVVVDVYLIAATATKVVLFHSDMRFVRGCLLGLGAPGLAEDLRVGRDVKHDDLDDRDDDGEDGDEDDDDADPEVVLAGLAHARGLLRDVVRLGGVLLVVLLGGSDGPAHGPLLAVCGSGRRLGHFEGGVLLILSLVPLSQLSREKHFSFPVVAATVVTIYAYATTSHKLRQTLIRCFSGHVSTEELRRRLFNRRLLFLFHLRLYKPKRLPFVDFTQSGTFGPGLLTFLSSFPIFRKSKPNRAKLYYYSICGVRIVLL